MLSQEILKGLIMTRQLYRAIEGTTAEVSFYWSVKENHSNHVGFMLRRKWISMCELERCNTNVRVAQSRWWYQMKHPYVPSFLASLWLQHTWNPDSIQQSRSPKKQKVMNKTINVEPFPAMPSYRLLITGQLNVVSMHSLEGAIYQMGNMGLRMRDSQWHSSSWAKKCHPHRHK